MARKKQPAKPRWTDWCQWCVRPVGGVHAMMARRGGGPYRVYWLCLECRGDRAPGLPGVPWQDIYRPVRRLADAGAEGGAP